ncbi:MAG TPA: GH36 C-terminal domain-containing protein [Bacteroidales bacterium]|nr:GH36 C-terminal domain-containing protein [Bacteroidales bacterium]HOK74942.1 GH36 C-terminal domain-containing protein [Bacteroidales bacterium]HOM39526.1 GH36 C-terminal domain-containing protein [Bacteroidales bacterium]HOU30136.1 GH36 C-terminal domain-containing protein [Bacteroidales bacterium]HPP91908.1 GH36 C-terminal domain-containing protein [Bacteroidales bacterium]
MGLDPEKTYRIEEINIMPGLRRQGTDSGRSYTGDYLMKTGLSIGSATPLTSVVYEITSQ